MVGTTLLVLSRKLVQCGRLHPDVLLTADGRYQLILSDASQTALDMMGFADPASKTSALLQSCVDSGVVTKRDLLNLLRIQTKAEVRQVPTAPQCSARSSAGCPPDSAHLLRPPCHVVLVGSQHSVRIARLKLA